MNKITLYTAQSKRVLDALEQDGVAYVKQEFILSKYEDTAWAFQEAYGFFARTAQAILPKPAEADLPYWLFADPLWASPEGDARQLTLLIPKEEVLLFDRRKWERILNLSPIGNEKEVRAFEEKLKKQGIGTPSEVFRTPFYPLLKQEIQKSWETLFQDIPDPRDRTHIQGAVWYLRKEWVQEIQP